MSMWISVKERMPERGVRVLVVRDGLQAMGMWAGPVTGWWPHFLPWVLPTHWMPLPEPPKEGE